MLLAWTSNNTQKFDFGVIDTDTYDIQYVKSKESGSELYDREILGRPKFRPFGITWTTNEILVASNRKIGVYSKDLEFLSVVQPENSFFLVNTHQILYDNDIKTLIGTCTADDRLLFAGPKKTQYFDVVCGSYSDAKFETGSHNLACFTDSSHINSITKNYDTYWTLMHRRGRQPSGFVQFTYVDNKISKVFSFDLGYCCHNIGVYGDYIYTLNTYYHSIVKHNVFQNDTVSSVTPYTKGFLRGLVVTEDEVIVGISPSHHENTDSFLEIYDLNLRFKYKLYLEGSGPINDLRCLNKFDFAHGIEPIL